MKELKVNENYTKDNFERIINKQEKSCKGSNINVLDHFLDVGKMVEIGLGAYRKMVDYKQLVGVDRLSKRANNDEVLINDHN